MENQKLEKALIADSELEEISGGAAIGTFITTNNRWYSSGNVPKYHKGQRVILQYEASPGGIFNLTCIVEGITETAECGDHFKEFGYTVKVIGAPDKLLMMNYQVIGEVVTGVYESCLRPA